MRKSEFKKKSAFLKAMVAVGICLAAYGSIFSQSPDVRPLPVGETIERHIAPGQIHYYIVSLRSNEVLKIDALEKGVDIGTAIGKMAERKIGSFANFGRGFDREVLTYIPEESGKYLLAISAARHGISGDYVLRSIIKETAGADDLKQILAEKLLKQGLASHSGENVNGSENAVQVWEESLPLWKMLNQKYWEGYTRTLLGAAYRSKGDLPTALKFFEEALVLNRAVGDKNGEALALNRIGLTFIASGNKQKALRYLTQAIPLSQAIGDIGGMTTTLNQIGSIYAESGDTQKALQYSNQALRNSQTTGNTLGEERALANIGYVYDLMGEKQQALSLLNRALLLSRNIGDKAGEYSLLINIGSVHDSLGDKKLALQFFGQALILNRAEGNKIKEAAVLNNMGLVYASTGEKDEALKYYDLALKLSSNSGDRVGEATTLNNIGGIYDTLGENGQALQFFERGLRLYIELGDKRGEATSLNNIALILDETGKKQEAIRSLNRVLVLRRSILDKRGEAGTLNNLGTVYFSLRDNRNAIRYFDQALPLLRALGNKGGESTVLNNLGAVYSALGDNARAIGILQRVLVRRREVGDISGEAATLGNISFALRSAGNPSLAAYYGKQSINRRQNLRGNALGFDTAAQKSFLGYIRDTYRDLAELLIQNGHPDQALQVLNLFQDQQFFDFSRDLSAPVRKLSLSTREHNFENRYEAAIGEVVRTGARLDKLTLTLNFRKANADETAQLEKLNKEYESAILSFEAVQKEAENEFSGRGEKGDEIPAVRDVEDMRSVLDELSASTQSKAAALYTLIGEEKFYVLMISADEPVKVFESRIKSADLEKKLMNFYRLLQAPGYDPRPLGKELFGIIINPVGLELEKQKIETLMWQLDGALRYIPVAALYDGKRYLAERYRNAVFTRADYKQMTADVSGDWTVSGFGNAKERTVSLLGDRISFDPLPAVGIELQEIIRSKDSKTGILNGEEFLDEEFTKEAMLASLKQKRPVVHIASHFSFRPGDAVRSFLLMGDGTAFTLADMKSQKGMFEGVELLTLSACNTAATQPNANGREIDGFAELAQRLGANAVMATLWKVADESTSLLMSEFYRLKKESPKLTKAEAIGLAQQKMLNGKLKASNKWLDERSKKVKTREDKEKSPLFKFDADKPFAHPYYWSPFVLIGNWK